MYFLTTLTSGSFIFMQYLGILPILDLTVFKYICNSSFIIIYQKFVCLSYNFFKYKMFDWIWWRLGIKFVAFELFFTIWSSWCLININRFVCFFWNTILIKNPKINKNEIKIFFLSINIKLIKTMLSNDLSKLLLYKYIGI